MFSNVNEFYALTYEIIEKCNANNLQKISEELNNALALGGSGLEIIAAINSIYERHAATLTGLVEESKLREARHFVFKAFGA